MTKYCGRDLLIQIDISSVYTTIGGLRSNNVVINNETVDVTDKGDAPWRQLLANCGIRSMSLSGSGVFTDDAALQDVLDMVVAGTIVDFKIISGRLDEFEGPFTVTSFERGGEHNAEETFSISLESASDITYTPAP